MAAKPKAIVTFIASRMEYLKCKASMPGGCSDKLFTDCVNGIIEQLSVCKPISCEDATHLHVDIKNSPLPDATLQQLSDAIDAKVSMEAIADDADVKKQVHMHLENYGTETFWKNGFKHGAAKAGLHCRVDGTDRRGKCYGTDVGKVCKLGGGKRRRCINSI